MEIQFEHDDDGFAISCRCGSEFVAAPGTKNARCPSCGNRREMGFLFEEWWRSEPTRGRFAYREA